MTGAAEGGPGRTIRTCRDVIEVLAEYMEGGLSADDARRLESHLADCGACVEFLDTLKRSKDAVATLRAQAVPEPCRRALRAFLEKERRRGRN
jgi:anti-sigma factor (TIGR02949 family)